MRAVGLRTQAVLGVALSLVAWGIVARSRPALGAALGLAGLGAVALWVVYRTKAAANVINDRLLVHLVPAAAWAVVALDAWANGDLDRLLVASIVTVLLGAWAIAESRGWHSTVASAVLLLGVTLASFGYPRPGATWPAVVAGWVGVASLLVLVGVTRDWSRPYRLALLPVAWVGLVAVSAGSGKFLLEPQLVWAMLTSSALTWLVPRVLFAVAVLVVFPLPRLVRTAPEREVTVPRWLLASVLVAVVIAGGWGIARQWPLNRDPDLTDQGAYLNYTSQLVEGPSTVVADRNRMPLFPYLMVPVVDTNGSIDHQMAAGKVVGIVVGALAVLGVGLWLLRRTTPLTAVAGVAVVLSTIVMFKAPYVQADLLSFFLLLASAVLCWRLLRTPTPLRGAAVGFVLAMAELSKSNAVVMLGIFVAVALVGTVLPRRFTGIDARTRRRLPLATASLIAVFAVTMAPYAAGSAHRYGSPTYNTNSTYYFWYDSWPEAVRGTESHGDSIGPANLPADQIPSLHRYLRTHDAGDVVARLRGGLAEQYHLATRSYGWWPVLELALTGSLMAYFLSRPHRPAAHRLPILFAGLTVPVYLLLTAWWVPIAMGERFTLVMALPVLLLALAVASRFGRRVWVAWPGWSLSLETVVIGALLVAALVRLPLMLSRAGAMVGGL